MANKLHKHLSEFARVPNGMLCDNNISLKAKGLFALIESKPEDWNFSASGLATLTKDSESSIQSGLRELEEFGLLKREKHQDERGHWHIDYHLYESKNPVVQIPVQENPVSEIPALENSQTYKRKTNKERLTKKDSTSTELLDLLNTTLNRNFKVLPIGYKKTLDTFTLEEIKQALEIMKQDKWHKERIHELKSDYLLRATTIDNMLARTKSKREVSNSDEFSQDIEYADGLHPY